MKPKVLLPSFLEQNIRPYIKPVEFRPSLHTLFIYCNVILLYATNTQNEVSWGFPITILYEFLKWIRYVYEVPKLT
jgi:hypothetical protein